jgi:hypothetical protein
VAEALYYFILEVENVQIFAEAIINNCCTNSVLLVCCHEKTVWLKAICFHPRYLHIDRKVGVLFRFTSVGNLSVMKFCAFKIPLLQ